MVPIFVCVLFSTVNKIYHIFDMFSLPSLGLLPQQTMLLSFDDTLGRTDNTLALICRFFLLYRCHASSLLDMYKYLYSLVLLNLPLLSHFQSNMNSTR